MKRRIVAAPKLGKKVGVSKTPAVEFAKTIPNKTPAVSKPVPRRNK